MFFPVSCNMTCIFVSFVAAVKAFVLVIHNNDKVTLTSHLHVHDSELRFAGCLGPTLFSSRQHLSYVVWR